jgi:hypothetical protein
MAMPNRFSLLDASFDRFLFASIGRQENDMPLSVASALARLGTDPWIEAERLAALPRGKATEALTAMIVGMSQNHVKSSDAPDIAARLILLLPSGTENISAVETNPAGLPGGWSAKLALLLFLALVVLASFNLFAA